MQQESVSKEQALNQRFFRAIAKVLILSVFVTVGGVYSVSPIGFGGTGVMYIAVLAAFPALLALLAIPITFFMLLIPSQRAWAVRAFVVALVCFTTMLGALRIGSIARDSAFHALATRSQPLVDAIHKYTKDTGAPPPSLKALVPGYLSKIPGTGMPAYPDYEYSTDTTRWHGNPWVLYVFTPSGGINFDIFVYYPLQNYPKNAHGGWLEPVQNWAYVHE